MKFKVSSQPLSAFSYSSLTDIVMLLLIFFLLSSSFVIQSGVKLKLPGSKLNEQGLMAKYVVSITANGEIYSGNKLVSLDALPGELSLLRSGDMEDTNLIIRADRAVPVELVIKVIDAAKAVGLDKFTIQTEKENL
jgi:biopolymer transport protein ExbD